MIDFDMNFQDTYKTPSEDLLSNGEQWFFLETEKGYFEESAGGTRDDPAAGGRCCTHSSSPISETGKRRAQHKRCQYEDWIICVCRFEA